MTGRLRYLVLVYGLVFFAAFFVWLVGNASYFWCDAYEVIKNKPCPRVGGEIVAEGKTAR